MAVSLFQYLHCLSQFWTPKPRLLKHSLSQSLRVICLSIFPNWFPYKHHPLFPLQLRTGSWKDSFKTFGENHQNMQMASSLQFLCRAATVSRPGTSNMNLAPTLPSRSPHISFNCKRVCPPWAMSTKRSDRELHSLGKKSEGGNRLCLYIWCPVTITTSERTINPLRG